MQFFTLGRNPELSRAEILSYLTARKISYSEVLFSGNFLILDCPKINIQDLGGSINSGDIIFSGNISEVPKFIEKEDIFPADKFTYSVLGNFSEIEDMLIDKFKKEKRKAIIRHGRKELKLQEGEYLSISNSDFKLLCLFHKKIFIGIVNQEYDYAGVKERDMKKPVRRESLAISPRLSKILINLTQVTSGSTLLDPFCGIGGILIEALLMGIKATGIDKDKNAIIGARQNLRWLEKSNKLPKYELINEDSRKAENRQFDGVACEPSLGELIRRKLTEKEAREFISSFEDQITGVLQKIKNIKKKEARIAITFPFIRNFSVNIQRVCNRTGLKVSPIEGTNQPIKEFRENQFVGREIVVLI